MYMCQHTYIYAHSTEPYREYTFFQALKNTSQWLYSKAHPQNYLKKFQELKKDPII